MVSLGLGQNYTVVVTPRNGFGNIGFLEPSSIKWGRKINDSSSAQIKIDLASGNAECCALARQLRTWGHQIRISRDGVLVWEGPITHLDYGGGNVVIDARDVSAWLARRVVRSVLDFRSGEDLSEIALQLIEHGLQRDDPNVLPYLMVTTSHISGERYYGTGEPKYILDELNELGRTGVDWTVIGRRIAVFPELSSATLLTLRQDDFMDELRVTEDGMNAATYAQVRGSGVVGSFGGESEFYGLLERAVAEDNILDQDTADRRAEAIVEAGSPVPLYITTAGQSRLACTAPVSINELVPGVRVTITLAAGEVCREVSTTMRLIGVDVDVSSGNETVSVNLTIPGVENQ
jgi:hypothetical protein